MGILHMLSRRRCPACRHVEGIGTEARDEAGWQQMLLGDTPWVSNASQQATRREHADASAVRIDRCERHLPDRGNERVVVLRHRHIVGTLRPASAAAESAPTAATSLTTVIAVALPSRRRS
jgi:hypothetical protein